MEIKLIEDQLIWDKFVISQPDYSFLHSWNWGAFNQKLGNSIHRLGVFDNNQLTGVMLLLSQHTRRGKFNFVPHGPIYLNSPSQLYLINEAINLSRAENLSFLRISPYDIETPESLHTYRALGFKPAPTLMHTEDTWLLDIRPPIEELLKKIGNG